MSIMSLIRSICSVKSPTLPQAPSLPTFPEAPKLAESSSDAMYHNTEMILVFICLAICVLGLFGYISMLRGLKKADNPTRELVVGFFRSVGALSPETAVVTDSFPVWLKSSSAEKNIFGIMTSKKIIRKVSKRLASNSVKAYYLDEEALKKLLEK